MRAQLFSKRLCLFGVLLALSVIMLGAYTRLMDAGLGCPDWPGCYGQLNAPSGWQEIAAANAAFPDQPVEVGKARTEMTHRYFASSLGGVIFVLGFLTIIKRKTLTVPVWLGVLLMGLVVFQGLLGMWTVTLKLLPIVVMAHLVGGFATLSLLWLYFLFESRFPHPPFGHPLPYNLEHASKGSVGGRGGKSASVNSLARLTLLILIAQIFLGGWTSANYAALICPDFPTCQDQWWPLMHFAKAFNLTGAIGLDNPLDYMDGIAKTTIHVSHRLGALLMFLLGSTLCYQLWRSPIQKLSYLLAFVLLLQISLGIANVVLHLPLAVAVAHNGIAALLLLVLITINFTVYQRRQT